MEKERLEELKAIIPEERIILDRDAILDAAKDYIGFRRYERDSGHNMAPVASCILMVNSTEEVSAVLRYLNEKKIDVVPRTGGSSVTMGLEPVEGGVILDGSNMTGIISIDEENMQVTARCGMPLEQLEKTLNEKGYTTGHFPQSLPMAQMGGLVATRSIGQFSTLYGGIEDLLVGLEAVLADGTVVRIKNVPRRSCGPDLRHLFIGSEGTLGFVTEVTVKMFKYNPEGRWMGAFLVKNTRKGLEVIQEIMREGYKPAVCRLHDAVELKEVMHIKVPGDSSLLLFICDGPTDINKVTGKAIQKICLKHKAVPLGSKPVKQWFAVRNDVCNDMDKPIYYNMGVFADTCEISAAWSDIADIYENTIERVHNEVEKISLIGGHASHCYMTGTNIYFQFAVMEDNYQKAREDYMQVISIIMEETLKKGGSIAHHHGSGKYRTKWMPEEHGSSYELMYRLKEMMDPNGILNKGVILVEK
ncbi:MAG: FAD-binding oxidoreductase [Clostridia bacterium]|nr:FAD-binding oxidoreductase [Clostridia bacterium]